ncbi:hypothetical protein [Actinomarinicola tropica]|uniref:Uncharacterized protein n=1 Tax=Actinomarinicola tropica TaxID=2789776 RepID=A0A5Q2RD19_9ACTN|nr:hypothetical protein [Actinomarinicola tropica]QGG94789.1 hypothetical protein GH723_06505 [Actinomarinicola tropica]
MADTDTTDELRRHQKVTAATDLIGVPAGTKGKVLLVNGLGPWIRYRVLFENGVERGNVLREQLDEA